MAENVVPMIHVPDVRATTDWYEGIGFKVLNTYGDGGLGLSFAMLSFGGGRVMFSQDGRPSDERRREVDLYVYTDDVDGLFEGLKDRLEIVEGLHDTFYGMREFIIRDLNRFWITFGQASAFDALMTAIFERDIDSVRAAINKTSFSAETLTAALAAASMGDANNSEITDVLLSAGAVPPLEIDTDALQLLVGSYRNEQGFLVDITIDNGRLVAAPTGEQPLTLIAINETTFRPIFLDEVTLEFEIEGAAAAGVVLTQGPNRIQFKRKP